MTILVTGANGFVGSKLIEALVERKKTVTATIRSQHGGNAYSPDGVSICPVDGLSTDTDWQAALEGVRVVIHCAAKVHDMRAGRNYEPFRLANVEGTIALAQQAKQAGVKRFVFLSSVKVHGEMSPTERPFHADDPTAPSDVYSRSKEEAEQALRSLTVNSPMELVIVRPPLVYGPGVRANFLSLIKAVDRSLPLPLAGITGNKRSLVSTYNLVDFLICVTEHPRAANEAFLISDDEYLSTAQLLHQIAEALQKRLYALPVPPLVLLGVAKLLGKQMAIQRLTSDLAVDISKAKELLGWNPPVSSGWALEQTIAQYRKDLR